MSSKGKMVVTVSLDTTEVEQQISDLEALIQSELEHSPDNFISAILSNLPAVLDDVVFTDISPAPGTGFNIIHRVRLGAKYERFAAAIRAGELNADVL